MPRNTTVHPVSPGAGGMLITYDNPRDFRGLALASAVAPPVLLTVTPKLGASGASRLTSAGMAAMVAAVASHIAGLSTANRDAISSGLPGGLSVTVTPVLVTVPCHAAGVDTLAAALQTVLSTGANVAVLSATTV